MTDTIPVKHRPDGLGEFEPSDTIGVRFGGTGAATREDARANLGAVGNTGDESIDGAKTFLAPVVLPGARLSADARITWNDGTSNAANVRATANGQLVLSCGAGTMYLRPNGDTVGAGQISIRTDGALILSATASTPLADTRESILLMGSTPSGATGQTNYWAKFATLDYSGSGTNHIHLMMQMLVYGVTTTSSAILAVSVRPSSNTNAGTPRLEILGGGSIIQADMFMATVDYTAGVATISLWVRKSNDFHRPYFYELGRRALTSSLWSVTYVSDSPWQAATPTGAVAVTSTWRPIDTSLVAWSARPPQSYGLEAADPNITADLDSLRGNATFSQISRGNSSTLNAPAGASAFSILSMRFSSTSTQEILVHANVGIGTQMWFRGSNSTGWGPLRRVYSDGDFVAPPSSAYAIGYVDCPTNLQNGASYTFALTDRGLCVRRDASGAGTYTIPADATVPFPDGAVITVEVTNASGSLTIAGASGVTLYVAGARSMTGNRTLVAGGLASIKKCGPNLWSITGPGVQ